MMFGFTLKCTIIYKLILEVSAAMQLPGNSSVPTSHHFKHRELESIKEEIKKLLPTFSLHTHSLKKIEHAKGEKIKERQTVTNFNLFKPELNRINTAAVFHQENKG